MKSTILILLSLGTLFFSSCQHPMTLETTVHEDGSLDKVITFKKEDLSVSQRNIFGIDSTKGWSTEVTQLPSEETKNSQSKKPEYRIEFKKHFESADQLNGELNTATDTLFHIQSSFEKKFRWFYTYIRYTETFHPINRFKMLSPEDYLNEEDNQFIERLPAEGTPLSKADSLYLHLLHVKTGEYFANMAIFNEEFEIIKELANRSHLDRRWMDTLARKREFIYDHIDKMKGDPIFAMKMADSLHLPLNRDQAIIDNHELAKDLNSRVNFMGFVNDGRYVNIINMPWTVVSTNADSVNGNRLVWRPLVTKFQFKEYPMYAEARILNVWPLVISAAVVILTILVWWKKGRGRNQHPAKINKFS